MTKSEVLKLLGISKLDKEITENILELCGIKPNLEGDLKYDGQEVCRFYAKASTYFKEYLPEFYVSDLLGISVNELLSMDIEYMIMPAEMQCLFYDSYPKGKFRYSKYVYNAIQVYKVMNVLSKSCFLEVPSVFANYYINSFISVESAISILGFTKVNRDLYHLYLTKLDIRYTCYKGKKIYLTDDICNVLDKAEEIFDKYIPFNQSCELYGYHTIRFLCIDCSFPAHTDPNILKYDVVGSDIRYRYGFRESHSFLDKEDIHKMYLKWFERSACEIFCGLKIKNFCYGKFECDWTVTHIDTVNNYGNSFSQPSVSVFGQRAFSYAVLQSYENDPEYENLDLLCKMWGLDGLECSEAFEKNLRKHKIDSNIKFSKLYKVHDFRKQYEKAVFYNALKNVNIKTLESEEYFNSSDQIDSLSFYFKKVITSSQNFLSDISLNSKKYIPANTVKYWNTPNDCNYFLYEDNIIYKNQQYISYITHRRYCLKHFYTSKLFNLYSSDKKYGPKGMHVNLDFLCSYNTNRYLQELIYNDFNTAVFVKSMYPAQMEITFLQHRKSSTITTGETIDKSVECWPIIRVINYLNLDKYSITLTWGILYNLGLSMLYYHGNLYIITKEVIELKKHVTNLLDEYTPVNKLYNLLHKSHPIIKFTDEIVAPPGMLYFLMPENNRSFYLIKKIPQKILDEVYNDSINCETLLTAAEVQGNLHILSPKIPNILAIRLLHIDNCLDDLDKTYSLYTDSSNVLCKRDAIIKLIELQKSYQENYVLEDNIPNFLNINIETLSKKDKELLNTISLYKAPNYIMHIIENKNLTSDRAYRKEDILRLCGFFHVPRNNQYDIKIDNNVTCEVPYHTYSMRLKPLELRETFEQISSSTAEIWDSYVRLQLSLQQCSEKTINSKINQYIKSLNILINMFKDNGILELSDFQTGNINRSFKSIGSNTYSGILLGFFKYASTEYANLGIKTKYRFAELKIPVTKRDNPDDILPETYNFTEYSKLFNYCNDYYTHIEVAVKEIIEEGTCIYASTWFYVMSHLNNAWRSNDFAMFPYIDILDVIYRNTSNDPKWYINNRMTKSDSTIIVLRIQNNPKIISKTKKYTRFTCSDELLETYATVYSLLALYTANNICYDTEFVNHFDNKYNTASKLQLEYFFSKFEIFNFSFKSRRLNKTLLSLIDFLENYYITNNIDIERRQAMLLRSHVSPSSTVHYIQKSKEVFDRLTNMVCARGEFGYAYEMMVRSIMDAERKLSMEDMTDKIREIRYMIPNMMDLDILYGFLNYTHKEQANLNEFINSLSLEELQTTLTKLYLNHLGSKMNKYLPCLKTTCQNSHGRSDECAYCVYHIPSIYSLSAICQSIKEDINCYRYASNDITRKKIVSNIFKKSRDIIWARQKYGDDILQEILTISGTEFDQFLIVLENFINTQRKMKQLIGDNTDA